MPSDNLLLYFAEDVSIQNHWKINGLHYKKTCEAWLKNLDRNKSQALDIISKIYGEDRVKKVFIMWRLFFLTCAESFGYNNGPESKAKKSYILCIKIEKTSLIKSQELIEGKREKII